MDYRPVELIVSLAARVVLGLGAGTILALVGYFFGLLLLAPNVGLSTALTVFTSSIGVAAGVGAFLGWIDLDDSPFRNLPVLVLAVAGGLIGAWGGLMYAHFVFDVPVTAGAARITAVGGGGVGANLPPLVFRTLKAIRPARKNVRPDRV